MLSLPWRSKPGIQRFSQPIPNLPSRLPHILSLELIIRAKFSSHCPLIRALSVLIPPERYACPPLSLTHPYSFSHSYCKSFRFLPAQSHLSISALQQHPPPRSHSGTPVMSCIAHHLFTHTCIASLTRLFWCWPGQQNYRSISSF